MRRLLGAVLVAVCVAASVVTTGARGERAPARLLVTAQEYSLMLSRQSIRSGTAVIQLLNRGEDPHDLRLRRIPRRGVSARRTHDVPETAAGELAELETRLPAGRYRLWCSLPGHRALGMRATLRVKRAR
jgi:hypothetical protein